MLQVMDIEHFYEKNKEEKVRYFMDPQWLQWAKSLQTMAQTGLTYSRDPYDITRYKAIREIAFAMMATNAQVDIAQVHDIFQEEHGHATPKVDVRAAVFKDDSVLLVKERVDGGWTLPGGWADVGESPSEAVAREVVEESGYSVRATRLLAVYDRNKHAHPPHPQHIYKIFFQCDLLGGEATTSSETDDVNFFPVDALPPLSVSRVTAEQIHRFFEFYRNPTQPADFD